MGRPLARPAQEHLRARRAGVTLEAARDHAAGQTCRSVNVVFGAALGGERLQVGLERSAADDAQARFRLLPDARGERFQQGVDAFLGHQPADVEET